jgi:urease accessory protein
MSPPSLVVVARAIALPAFALLLLPSVAAAHTGAGPAHGFLHGLAHPLLGADHVLVMFAVGLWAAQRGGSARVLYPLVFVAAMILGSGIGMLGVALPSVEAALLASLLVLGGAVAFAVRMPIPAGAIVVALFALFHGHAHGAAMPPALSGVAYGVGFSLATMLLHAAGLAFGLVSPRLLAARRIEPVRVVGAAIGLAGVTLWLL